MSNNTFEFAKRWFYQGVEITGFSLGGLMSVYKKYPLLYNFLLNQASHGWILPTEVHPGLIRSIFSIQTKPYYISNKVESMCRLYLLFDALMLFERDKSQEACELFFSRIAPMAPGYTIAGNFISHKEAFIAYLTKAKYMLVESDLYKFQNDAYKINVILNDITTRYIQSLGDQISSYESDFIRRAIALAESAVLKMLISVITGKGKVVTLSANTAFPGWTVLKTQSDPYVEYAMSGFVPSFRVMTLALRPLLRRTSKVLIRRFKVSGNFALVVGLIAQDP